MAPRKGRRKDTPPITRLGLSCLRSDSGSISAPARKVRSPEPKVARKSIQGVVWNPRKLPPMTPTNISTRATEMSSLMEMTLATSASPIQAAATNQMFSIRCPPAIECQPPGEPEGRRYKAPDRPPGHDQEPSASLRFGQGHPAPADSIADLSRTHGRCTTMYPGRSSPKRIASVPHGAQQLFATEQAKWMAQRVADRQTFPAALRDQ